jgi:hypothetical protein
MALPVLFQPSYAILPYDGRQVSNKKYGEFLEVGWLRARKSYQAW